MSSVLWEFIEPWMGPREQLTLEIAQTSLEVASQVWNAVVLEQCGDEGDRLRELREHACRLPAPHTAEMLDLIDFYRQRKLALFGADHREILGFEVTETKDDFHVKIESRERDRA